MKKFLTCFAAADFLFVSACKKKDTSNNNSSSGGGGGNPPPPTGLSITTPCTVSATIGGSPFSFTEDGATYQVAVGSSGNVNTPPTPTDKIYSCDYYNDATSQSIFSIQKGTLSFLGNIADSATFTAFFPKTSYNYSTNAANGIDISWWDAGNVQWSTGFGAATQTGSTFTVTEMISKKVLGYQDVKIKGTFNCTLYDGSGNSKTVTNGNFVAVFESL